jgi:hypothetical protein
MQVGVLFCPQKIRIVGFLCNGSGHGYHAGLIVRRDLHADVVKAS